MHVFAVALRHMNTPELRDKLLQLTTAQINRLAEFADVSVRAIWNVRSGTTITASEGVRQRLRAALRSVGRARAKSHKVSGGDK